MRPLSKQLDRSQPWWSDYLPFIGQLKGSKITDCQQLNALLPVGLKTEAGHPVQFVASTELDDGPYEQRIYTTGQVSTRPDNWHDLFNALVWLRFPRIKTAMNTLHFHAWPEQKDGARGNLRDALTLFDECGVIVCSDHLELLDAIARRRWTDVFRTDRFHEKLRLFICGHAMLEKYLAPYKSMTAKALLIHAPGKFQQLPRNDALTRLDQKIAERMLAGALINEPACLAPLPLAGIPGWWPDGIQDEDFYGDLQVFRPPPSVLEAAPIAEL